MNLQVYFAQKKFTKSLKLAEIDLFHSNAKIVSVFSEKKTKSGKSRPHALKCLIFLKLIFENYENSVIDLIRGKELKSY